MKPHPSLLGVLGKKHPRGGHWPWCSAPCWVRGVLQPRSFPRRFCCPPGDGEDGRAGAGGAWRPPRAQLIPAACCGRDDVCWQAAGRPQSRPSTPGGHSGLALLWCSVRRAQWSFVSPDRSHNEPIYRRTERRGVKARVARDPCVPACFGLSATLAIGREVYLSPRRSYVVVPFPPLGRHAPVSARWGRW